MRVVILNNDFRAYWKGRLAYLHRHLPAYGIDVFAVELFGKGSPYAFDTFAGGTAWWRCLFPQNSAGELEDARIKQSVFAALDEIRPDVVIGPSIVFYAGALGIAWAKHNRMKFVMFDDARPSQVKRNFVVQWVKNLITSNADAFWLPTGSYDNEYAIFKQAGLHFFYGFACIDNDMFKPAGNEAVAEKNIVCIARLVPIKNFAGLLNAWKIVEQQHTGYRLQIVGDGPEGEALKELQQALGLQTVDFIDAVPNTQLPALYSKAEAFVLASFSETWGLVVNEAMAAGKPVLLSHTINAAADLLNEGSNGFGFDAFNVEDIARAISRYIALSPAEKQAMSSASLEYIKAFSYQNMAARLAEALKIINAAPFNKPGLLAAAIISTWHGRYNTSGWDKL